jgi:hypothetical protein
VNSVCNMTCLIRLEADCAGGVIRFTDRQWCNQTQAVADPDDSMQHYRCEAILAILTAGTVETWIRERSRDKIASFAISYILRPMILDGNGINSDT